MPSNLHLNVSEIVSYPDVSGHVEHCLTLIDSNMPTHKIAGIIDMDNITLCSVTRDLHHQLELRSPSFPRNQTYETPVFRHLEHTSSEPGGTVMSNK